MKKLIVTADDYGVFPAVNQGIIDAVNDERVNSVAVFSNYEGEGKNGQRFPSSVENVKTLIRQTGTKAEIGCHLTITSGKPVTDKVPFLLDEDGYFLDYTEFRNFTTREQLDGLMNELYAQVEVLKGVKDDDGNPVPIRHLTNHHNSLTLFPHHFNIYMGVARGLGLPMRSPDIRPTKKQNRYLNVLRFIFLPDNLSHPDSQAITDFGRIIKKYFKDEGGGVISTSYMDSSHYGPIPLRDIMQARVNHFVREKNDELRALLDDFRNDPDATSLELMLHLGAGEVNSIDQSHDLVYPGVNRKYFDSRVLEYKSIMNSPDIKNPLGITRSGWSSLMPPPPEAPAGNPVA